MVRRKWLRKASYAGLAGVALTGIGSAILRAHTSQSDRTATLSQDALSQDALSQDAPTFAEPIFAMTSNGAVASYTPVNEPFRDAINLATTAANQTQAATTSAEWSEVAAIWQNAIDLLNTIPPSDPNYTTALSRITTYTQNLTYAQTNARQ